MVSEADVAESVVCGPDPQRHQAAIEEFAAAGYDHVYVHQVGPDQEGFSASTSARCCPNFADRALRAARTVRGYRRRRAGPCRITGCTIRTIFRPERYVAPGFGY